MVIASSIRDDLAASVRRALAPQRFPTRRDVELAFAVADGKGTSFFDYVWLDERLLASVAVRLPGIGLEVALKASSLRQLIRALMQTSREPWVVLSRFSELADAAAVDAAMVVLDLESSKLDWAGMGMSAVSLAGGNPPPPSSTVGPGVVWLSVGPAEFPAAAEIPVEGVQALVDPVLDRSGSGAVGVIHFKGVARSMNTATFVVPNERAEIPAFLEAAGRFFARQGIGEDDVAGVEVALDEILTNQVNYGYKDGLRHEVLVAMKTEPGRLEIEVRDEGSPFDPLSVPEPDLSDDIDQRQIGGLGMHFVKTLLDKVSYRRSNGWNVLTLEKTLRQDEDRRKTRP